MNARSAVASAGPCCEPASLLRHLLTACVLAVAAQASTAQTATLSLTDAIQQALAQNPQQLSQRPEIDRAGSGLAAARAAPPSRLRYATS